MAFQSVRRPVIPAKAGIHVIQHLDSRFRGNDENYRSITMPSAAIIVTPEHLAAIAGTETKLMPALAEWINHFCPRYEIDNPQEYAHFLSQPVHETDHFRTLQEYASGKNYEGRADLGNKNAGDGVRYKG